MALLACAYRDERFPSAAVGSEARLLAADVLSCGDAQVHLQATTGGRIIVEGCGRRLVLQRCLPHGEHPSGYFQVRPFSEDDTR